MTREIKIAGLDIAALGVQLQSMQLVTRANQGEVGIGSFTFDDPGGTFSIAAWQTCNVTETDETEPRIFTGYTGSRTFTRGYHKAASGRLIDVDIIDLNCRLSDILIRDQSGLRDREEDEARVDWLTNHASMSFLATAINPLTNLVTMDAADYRGKTALDVLNDCSEASGKTFFLTWDSINGFTLYYDLTTGTSLSSTYRISDVLSDASAVTVHPIDASRELDASAIYSGVDVFFKKGSVYATNSSVVTAMKQREIAIDSENRTADGASNYATNFLDESDADTETISCSLLLDSDEVNRFPAGYRFQVKLRALGITSFTYYRTTSCTITPAEGPGGAWDKYKVTLEFAPRIKAGRAVRARISRPALLDETIPNGGFESGPQDEDNYINDWNVVTGTARTYDAPTPPTTTKPKPVGGSRALRVVRDVAASIVTEDFAPIEGGKRYHLRGYAMWNTANGATIPSAANMPSLAVYFYTRAFVQVGTVVTIKFALAATGIWRGIGTYYTGRVMTAPGNAYYRKVRIITAAAGASNQYLFFDSISFTRTDLISPPTS